MSERDPRFRELDLLIRAGVGEAPEPAPPIVLARAVYVPAPAPTFGHIDDKQLRRRFQYLARTSRWDELDREQRAAGAKR